MSYVSAGVVVYGTEATPSHAPDRQPKCPITNYPNCIS